MGDSMKAQPYPVYAVSLHNVSDGSDGLHGPSTPEQMGSKKKFWIQSAETGVDWLVKFSRENNGESTGEHWSEKIAAEIASVLQVPHPQVELGTVGGKLVSLTRSFIVSGQFLVHGNELLSQADPDYPKDDTNCRTREHTLEAVKDSLLTHAVGIDEIFSTAGLTSFGQFTGYLLLDALICNTDRHHENWAAISHSSVGGPSFELAPSYDHASSLGRELPDHKRSALLTTKDGRGDLVAYCHRATSALFSVDGTNKPLLCLEAYKLACDLDPIAAEYWTQILSELRPETLLEIVQRVPDSMMTAPAKDFAAGLLVNRLRMLQNSQS